MSDNSCGVFYKYLDPARLDVVANLRIRFTQPSALNDPYECTVALDGGRMQELVAQSLRKLVPSFLPGLTNLEGMIADATAKMEAGPSFEDEISKARLRERLDQNYGVLALSATAVNTRLWSLYAAGHRGYCLGLHRDAEMFRARAHPDYLRTLVMRYEDSPPVFPLHPLQRAGLPPMNTDGALELFLASKSKAWADEQEVRIVQSLSTGGSSDLGNDPSGHRVLLFPIRPEAIASIVIGARASGGLEKDLRRYCAEHGISPRFQRIVVPFGSYEIRLVEA